MDDPSAGKNPAIYIVDDDPDVRSSVSFLLEATGWTNSTFSSGMDFLNSLEELKPGCVLLDVRMPDMDGSQVLREMRRRQVRWPVVIMTGHGDLDLAVEIMKLGAVDYIEKPFSRGALQESLQLASGTVSCH